MKYLISGGDERMLFAAEALCRKGNTVCALGMDRAVLPEGAEMVSELCAADCFVLPLPVEIGRRGALNAPFAEQELCAAELIGALPEGALVCGGKISPTLKIAAQKRRLRLVDYLSRPELNIGNAALTAEAAIALLMQRTDFTLFGRSVLIIGFGRIGKLLCHKLTALGVKVHLMSANPESRAMAEELGCTPHIPNTPLPRFDAVINTAPAAILTRLDTLLPPCLILELASAPGGFDSAELSAQGHRYFAAPGLPAKYAPRTAGKLIADTVMNIVKEYENE